MTFYNDNGLFVCEWLRNLAAAGHITRGVIDSRPIQEVQAQDVEGFTRAHFFAGIAGWDYALQLAGWPADRPVWTGSCPCQPFSVAGRRRGAADERHLWPEWFRLIRECRPPTIFGEQVASRDGREWLAGIFTDLEALGYAVAGADLCAAGVGAPHIRQRLYWCAIANDGMADASIERRQQECRGTSCDEKENGWQSHGDNLTASSGATGGLDNADDARSQGRSIDLGEHADQWASGSAGQPGFWSAYDIIPCIDGKARRVISGSQLVAAGLSPDVAVLCPTGAFPNRRQILQGAGNAIVPEIAAQFTKTIMEVLSYETETIL